MSLRVYDPLCSMRFIQLAPHKSAVKMVAVWSYDHWQAAAVMPLAVKMAG